MTTKSSAGHRAVRFTITVALVLFALSAIKLYRVRAAEEATQYPPSTNSPVVIPANTEITATLRNGIVESAKQGEPITAFVAAPVTIGDRVAIPAGSQLKGNLKDLSVLGQRGRATIAFNTVSINGRNHDIHTRPVIVMTPLLSDMAVLGGALRSLMGVSLGTAIGASSRDLRMVESGVIHGTWESEGTQTDTPMTVVLLRDAKV
jgi:hypothetical protein